VAFRPRKIPPEDSSSALANGNAAASALVSNVRQKAQGVDPDRQRGDPALQGAERHGTSVEKQRGAERANPVRLSLERLLVRGPDRHIQADPKEPAISPGERPGKLRRVLRGHLGLRVLEPVLLGLDAPRGLEPRQLPAEMAGSLVVSDRFDVKGDVDRTRIREQRRQPPWGYLARVTDHREGLAPRLSCSDAPREDLGCIGSEHARRRSRSPAAEQPNRPYHVPSTTPDDATP